MRTYGELFAIGEFRALFVSRCLVIASLSLASLALATLVYEETGSPVLSALALFGGSLLTLLGSLTALSLSDRLDARSAILLVIAVTGAQAALQAVPGLPLPVRFALLAVTYLVPAIVGGSLIRLLRSIVSEDGFVLGRATPNVGVGLMQVVAFAAGALLLRVLATTGLFLVAAALMVGAAAVLLAGVRARPIPARPLPALPYLGFLFHPPVGVALVLGFVASAGYSAFLVLQERLAHEADPDVEGQVFGLFGNGQMVGQSLGALAGGLLATVLSPDTSMGLLAAASVLVTVSLNAGLRRSRRSLANV